MATLLFATLLLTGSPQAEVPGEAWPKQFAMQTAMQPLVAPLPAPGRPLPPVPPTELLWSSPNYVAPDTWRAWSDEDLLARLMIAEQSYKILDPVLSQDAVGAAWVAVNRTDPAHGFISEDHARGPYALWRVAAWGQFYGLRFGNVWSAADPEAYPRQFAAGDPQAGRRAYWRARGLAWGILHGFIPDPTDGALYFADMIPAPDKVYRERTAFWKPGEVHLTIPEREEIAAQ